MGGVEGQAFDEHPSGYVLGLLYVHGCMEDAAKLRRGKMYHCAGVKIGTKETPGAALILDDLEILRNDVGCSGRIYPLRGTLVI